MCLFGSSVYVVTCLTAHLTHDNPPEVKHASSKQTDYVCFSVHISAAISLLSSRQLFVTDSLPIQKQCTLSTSQGRHRTHRFDTIYMKLLFTTHSKVKFSIGKAKASYAECAAARKACTGCRSESLGRVVVCA